MLKCMLHYKINLLLSTTKAVHMTIAVETILERKCHGALLNIVQFLGKCLL